MENNQVETQAETFTVSRTTFNYVVIAAVFMIAGLLIGGLAFGQPAADTEPEINVTVDQATLNEIVAQTAQQTALEMADTLVVEGGGATSEIDRESLLEIVREAVEEVNADSGTTQLIDDDPSLGPDDAVVTIVEFSDFNCPFCARYATETFNQIVETYGDNVQIVFRDMPVVGGQDSVEAAIAAECAGDQEHFWEFHNDLFEDSNLRGRSAYIDLAESYELDVETFSECLDSVEKNDEITLDLLDGQELGVRGVPAFFINGRFVSGAQPFGTFASVIDVELRRNGIEPPDRTDTSG